MDKKLCYKPPIPFGEPTPRESQGSGLGFRVGKAGVPPRGME